MPSHADPRAEVVAPVHRALEFLVLRGAASFAVAVLAVFITALAPTGNLHLVGHAALPIVLAFVTLARIGHNVLRRRPWDGERAWSRAAEIDSSDTLIAATVAIAVPVAWAIGGAAVLAHHFGDPASRPEVLGVWLPLGGGLWAAATVAWAGDCRERLARALEASEEQFRAYWAGIGRL
jgi:hypothetical protein